MATKKTKEVVIPVAIITARMCGSASGLNDKLGSIQRDCLDIAGRVALITDGDDALHCLTPKERAALEKIKSLAEIGFEDMMEMRESIEQISRRSPEWLKVR